jgi:sialate O-acetylesterase
MRIPIALALLALAARAEVTLPNILAEHMVVQRGVPVHIWGTASPGEAVTVGFRGETRATAADTLGRWSVYLPPGEAGGPFELKVNNIVLQDVLVGDVWVGSGQSNMEWPVSRAANAEAEIAAAKHPRIRLFRAMHRVSDHPLRDIYGDTWKECTPDSVKDFSAVAYYFGRELQDSLKVPIGLIQSAWGGTPAEAWTSLAALGADASLMPVFGEWARMTENYAAALMRYDLQAKAWEKAKAEGRDPGRQPARPNGPGGSWQPAGLYNAMIAPLTPFPIRGVIWYQGESNASPRRAPLYGRLFQAMIRDWRAAWGLGDFPFLFVQLANYKTSPESMWPELREAQRQTLALRNTGMAVTIDIGNPDDIHPRNKQDVGLRLALAARAIAHGEAIEHSGPLFRQATQEGASLRAWFDHAAGLRGSAKGFEVAGADRKYVPAEARIDGATVVVSSAGVPAPTYVRYGWADNPGCELFNAAGLPASPFISEP